MNSAWLIHAPQGYGKWPLLQRAAAALLCESPQSPAAAAAEASRLPSALTAYRACGRCASCALLAAGTHPDFLVAAPEALWPELGLNLAEESSARSDAKTAASQDIRIEQIRRLNDWAVSTSHRGRAKVALVYPLDALNPAAANALLKTLEEPPEDVQFLLGAHRIDVVLPTLCSRCRLVALPRPSTVEAQGQLGQFGTTSAKEAVLAWSQGAVYQSNPAAGLEWAEGLIDALAQQPSREVSSSALPPPPDQKVGVATLLKIGSDLQRVLAGSAPLYLPQKAQALAALAGRTSLLRLAKALRSWTTRQRLAGFPLNQALASDALLLEFAQLFSRGD